MRRRDIEGLVWAFVGHKGLDVFDQDPETAIERMWSNRALYPDGLAAMATELGLEEVRPELLNLLAWRGRQLWATVQVRLAAREAIDAGCPLRVAARSAGVTHQTVANWANRS